jgi:hypothetical protein
MADVTIDQLPLGTPSGSEVIPYSNGTTTHRVAIQNLPVAYSSVTNKPNLANVATSGDYNDLINKPLIGVNGIQAFTSSGIFTVPAGITRLKITAIGGGGGGGLGRSVQNTGGNAGQPGAGGIATGGDFNLNGITGSVLGSWIRSYGAGGVGGGENFSRPGGRGGSGAVVLAVVSVTPSTNYNVTIGAGGGSQTPGGTTTFIGNNKSIYAGGGSPGTNAMFNNSVPGGTGTSGYLQIEW